MTVYEKIVLYENRYKELEDAIPREYWDLCHARERRKRHTLDIAAVVNPYFSRVFYVEHPDWDEFEVEYGPETTTVSCEGRVATFPTEWVGMGAMEWRAALAVQMQREQAEADAAKAAKRAATKEKRDRAAWERLAKKFGPGGIDNPPASE